MRARVSFPPNLQIGALGWARFNAMIRISFLFASLLLLRGVVPAQIVPKTFENSPQIGSDLPQTGGPPQTIDQEQSISWKAVVPNILHDQKEVYWNYPRSLAHGNHWLPTGAFLAATGALIAVDQYESPYFRRSAAFHGFNGALSGTNSSLLIAGVPAATYLVGLVKKDRYAQSTALWTGEAIADSELTAEVLKLITRRARPESIQLPGNFGDTWVDSRTATDGGFPSGHTISAFSVATVMSMRYGHDHRWVPLVAYGLATTVGFSRVTLSAHNVSDVFAGAAIGYAISRFVVLAHHHR